MPSFNVYVARQYTQMCIFSNSILFGQTVGCDELELTNKKIH